MSQRVVLVALMAGCADEFVDDLALVDEPRLLAVQAEPAEARPGADVTLTALWADPLSSAAPLEWAYCIARKAFVEPGPMAMACLDGTAGALIPIGEGATATGALPDTGCRVFGPDQPEPVPGEDAARPADPDTTGGFFQPLRIGSTLDATVSLAQVRIRCGLPAATPAQARQFSAEYVENTNPAIVLDTATVVAPGEELAVTVEWPACDAAPCAGAEPFLWFEPSTRTLINRRETIRIAYYASAGSFAGGNGGCTEAEAQAGCTRAENRWRAPDATGDVRLWVVVRDDRGGTAWVERTIAVTR